MLNGDVLTDIDLTAQLRQHERTGARATLALIAVEDPSAYGLVPLGARTARSASSSRSPAPRPDRHESGQRRRVRARARGARRMPPAGTNSLDRARRVPAARRRRPVRLTSRAATGSTSAPPRRYLQGTFDILERARRDRARPARWQAAGGAARPRRHGRRPTGRVVAPALLGSRLRARSRGEVGGPTVLGDDVTVGQEGTVERLGRCSTAPGSAREHDQWLRSSARRVELGERLPSRGRGVVLGGGVRVGAGNTLDRPASVSSPSVQLPDAAIAF